MTEFAQYNNVIFKAFQNHTKQQEIIERKHDIVRDVERYYGISNSPVLFVGFNPAILAMQDRTVYVAEVSESVLEWIRSQNIDAREVDVNNIEPVKTVVATDEYLTFADTDEDQLQKIRQLCGVCRGIVITTVKDYKNQEFKDREYSQPAVIRGNDGLTAFTELHDWDIADKNSWETTVYQLNKSSSECLGVYRRRTMFFKQLAKFTRDAGATDFLVHKNMMYKSLIKKNYEHVISIQVGA